MARREELHNLCGRFAKARNPKLRITKDKKLDYLTEMLYVESELVDRMIEARYANTTNKANVFISHSSKDKEFAKWIASDLHAAGHVPWLDVWSISVGESIPQKIAEGITCADFVLVILSRNFTTSKWVEKEWEAKYWDEVTSGKTHVLPVLLQSCRIPTLLKAKRYADFRENYNDGLADILSAIDRLQDTQECS